MPLISCLGCKYYDQCELEEPIPSVSLGNDIFIKCEAINDLRKVFSSMRGNLFLEYYDFSKDQSSRVGKFFEEVESAD